jgi:hypothetical protein
MRLIHTLRERPNHRILPALVSSALVLTAIYLFYIQIYRHYFPFGDDPAVFQASAGSPESWFTQGFSRYFMVYPEWRTPFTDFMRPGVNLIIHLNQIFFGHNYAGYFISYYGAQLLVCLVALLVAQHFGVPSRWLILVALTVAINPAFIGLGIQRAAFYFDVWCGLFAILSLYFILERRYGLAIVALTISLFIKETSLYAPIAAAITVYMCTRRKLVSACMLLPLALWALAWKYVFHGSSSGIYALPNQHKPGEFLQTLIQGFLIWPSGVFDEQVVRKILLNHSILPNLVEIILGALNLLLWCFFAAIAVQLLRPFLRGKDRDGKSDPELLSLFIWVIGALSFGILVGRQSRFGGSIYPLEVICCAVVYQRTPLPIAKKMAGVSIAAIAFSFLWSAQATIRQRDSSQSDSMRSLVTSLRKYNSDVIYVLNSPSAFSAPSAIEDLAGTSSRIVVLSQFAGCPTAPWPKSAAVHRDQAKADIVSNLPPCAHYEFDGVDSAILARGFKANLSRGTFATYDFPDAKVTGHGLLSSSLITSIDMGKQLKIEIAPKADKTYTILYYDWPSGEYKSALD